MNRFRALLTTCVLILCSANAFAQTAIIFEISEGRYVGLVTTATGQQFALTNIVITKLRVIPPTDPPVDPPVDPTTKIDRVTYVFEKDANNTPKPVAFALQRLNAEYKDVIATEFEEDTVDGDGDVPDQYKIALEAARKEGLPALVIQAGTRVVKVVKAPKTEQQVMDEVLK